MEAARVPRANPRRSGRSRVEAVKVSGVFKKDGEIVVKGLPFKKGQHVEMIIFEESAAMAAGRTFTADELLNSGLIGLWADRDDIGDSVEFARKLREQSHRRWVLPADDGV
ncbi:MAG: hypothetical protein HYX78_08905 [Armatimonadetes bacterium]|nr:hypothetical protein [Armatimonadota bacterium]